MHRALPNQTDIWLKYSLETEMLNAKTRQKCHSENIFQMCNNNHFKFCNPETAFYQTYINKFCVIDLFRQNAHGIKILCKQMVVLDQQLPTTSYLSYGI